MPFIASFLPAPWTSYALFVCWRLLPNSCTRCQYAVWIGWWERKKRTVARAPGA